MAFLFLRSSSPHKFRSRFRTDHGILTKGVGLLLVGLVFSIPVTTMGPNVPFQEVIAGLLSVLFAMAGFICILIGLFSGEKHAGDF